MRTVIVISLIVMMSAGALSPVHAQDAEAQREDALREQAQEAREQAELRVESEMVKMSNLAEALSKTLGQMHYLRTLCFGEDDQVWRDHMAELLRYEAPRSTSVRANLTRAFNTGYYQEQRRHATCSESVSVDVAALAENGRSLAEMLGDPYRSVPGQTTGRGSR